MDIEFKILMLKCMEHLLNEYDDEDVDVLSDARAMRKELEKNGKEYVPGSIQGKVVHSGPITYQIYPDRVDMDVIRGGF